MPKKKSRQLTPEQELARRRARRAFSLEAVAGGHAMQFAYLTCREMLQIALCSRRAGKSFANMAKLADNALANPGSTNLYLGLTAKAVLYSIVPKLWNRLVKTYALPFSELNADLVATCENGSIVRFASVDDRAHIQSFLGDDLAGGIVIIDEAQSLARAVLEELVEVILIPALTSTTEEHPTPGQLCLTGTVPQVAAGYFYEKFTDPASGFQKFNWNRFQNPFLKNQKEALERTCRALGISETHPLIRRDWFGELVFDANETAYRYVSSRSTYVPTELHRVDVGPFHCLFAPIMDCDRVIVGIDPAQRKDRFAITVFAYHSRRRDHLYQIAEAVTDPGADPLESQWLEVLRQLKARYGTLHKVIRDPGSSSATNDTLLHSHGILVESAIKGPGSLKARVDLLADLLARGICLVIKDGELDRDLQIAKWSTDALEKGKWAFDKLACSPDVCDSASYIVPEFTTLGGQGVIVKPSSEDEYWAEQTRKHLEKIWVNAGKRQPRPRPPSIAANLHRIPSGD